MADKLRSWDPWKMYDVKPEEMRAIKERAKMRSALKAEWTKKFTDPWKGAHPGGHLFDPSVQRFIALKATETEHYKGTFRSLAISGALLVVPVVLLTYIITRDKAKEEKRYRSGEVMYKDRPTKFL